MQRPLSDIRVLDFSTLLPGPMATLMLAEAGAEVIKIERPGTGEEMRGYTPRWGRDSVNFQMLNRGKRSVALDLKAPDAGARLRPLIETADVLVEQFRPGVMARLGLGYGDARAINPRLVYCSITGYGQDGPKAGRAGHDLNYLGDAGLLALGHGPTEAPVVPPALIADIAGGAWPAVMNILMALRAREGSGEGCHLDIAMAEGVLPFAFWALGEGQVTGHWPGSGEGLLAGGSPRYRLYPTADGRVLAAAPLEQKFWEAFCEAIALPAHLRDDSADPGATARAVAGIIAAQPAEHWRAIFDRADCCCTLVQDLQAALADPQFRARGSFASGLAGLGGERIAALPVPLAAALRPASDTRRAPALGADDDLLDDPAP